MAHRRSRLVRPAPRSNVWVGAGLNATVITGVRTLLQTLNAAALAVRPFTIVRTHLSISYNSDQVAATETTQAVFAMQVVTESAAAGGVTTVPTGISETDGDFFVYKPLFSGIELVTAIGFVEPRGDSVLHLVDSKAMRKVAINDDVVQTLELRNFLGVEIAIEGRMLIKLH